MAVLLRHNLDSAFAITRYDAAGFIRAFAGQARRRRHRGRDPRPGQADLRRDAEHDRRLPERPGGPGLGGQVPVQYGYPPQPAPPSYPVIAYPTLEDLFGSLDYCNCSDCGSILSPAAYLVDLLNYIDQPAPAAGLPTRRTSCSAAAPTCSTCR